ncbi:hypothetical protein [Thiolapillus brandeum]|uniref:hypothetical protein n=1 Tax=Thiolapillus brandeum TaxID=1076588 RepID=UPI000596DA35|nr:hypothetical protein [Thiolapillus brandeum]
MKENRHHEFEFTVDVNHPCIEGHFPDNPIVPAVVLLDQVLTGIDRVWSCQPRHLSQAKFLRPLVPGERATVCLERDATRIRFSAKSGAELLFNGSFLLS